MIVQLRRKYRIAASPKNQKSKSSNSGSSKKNARKGVSQKHAEVSGEKILLVNFAEPMYCAGSGARLPQRGMVVRNAGKYYRGFDDVN
jgi:hypothetical protein